MGTHAQPLQELLVVRRQERSLFTGVGYSRRLVQKKPIDLLT